VTAGPLRPLLAASHDVNTGYVENLRKICVTRFTRGALVNQRTANETAVIVEYPNAS
jgi:hypothetical protein